jgi:hypothetical protein
VETQKLRGETKTLPHGTLSSNVSWSPFMPRSTISRTAPSSSPHIPDGREMTLERRGSHLVPRPFQINVFLGLDLSALFEFRLPRHGELCALSETLFPLSRRPSSRSRLQFFFGNLARSDGLPLLPRSEWKIAADPQSQPCCSKCTGHGVRFFLEARSS